MVDGIEVALEYSGQIVSFFDSGRVVHRTVIGEFFRDTCASGLYDLDQRAPERFEVIEQLTERNRGWVFVIIQVASTQMAFVVDVMGQSDMAKIGREHEVTRRHSGNYVAVVDDSAVEKIAG